MLNWFKRLFKIGEAEANAALDKLENPIHMIELGIINLKEDLNKGLASLAEVKALVIKTENEQKEKTKAALDYEQKAMLLLQKANAGNLDLLEGDRLAGEALLKKQDAEKNIILLSSNISKYQEMVSKIDSNNKLLRNKIEGYEGELSSLKARVKVAKSTKEFNKKLAGLDSNNTLQMLERMKDKIAQEEALAEAYGEIVGSNRTVDEQINKALEGSQTNPKIADSLAQLKLKIGNQNRIE